MNNEEDMRNIANQCIEEWIKCEKSVAYFIEKYCKLKDQKIGAPIPFTLWPCQHEQLEIWENNKYSITLKPRQIGISWESAAFALHQAMFKKFFEIMCISRKESDAIKYLDKAKFMYKHLPEWMRDLAPTKKITLLSMEFEHESTIMVESSNPEAGRSETLNLLIMDENAFIKDASTIWTAAQPTLEKADGKAILISTANGYDKSFQPKYEAAKRGENGFAWKFIDWRGDPNRTEEWYKSMEMAAISENRLREFHQEYPRNDMEAFIISGQTFFDPDLIQKLILKKRKLPKIGNLESKKSHFDEKNIQFIPHAKGFLKIYEFPQEGEEYCGGVDTAEGIEKGDWSVCPIYNRRTKKQVAELSGRMDTDLFAKNVYILGKYYNFALLNIEMNSIGESLMNYLVKQRHYPKIFRRIAYDERSNKKVRKLGWKTTNSSKRLALDAMGMSIRDNEMYPCSEQLLSEMKTFVIERTDWGSWTYKASGNNHDDHVIAHALTAIIFQEMPALPSKKKKVNPKYKQRFRKSQPKVDRYAKMFA